MKFLEALEVVELIEVIEPVRDTVLNETWISVHLDKNMHPILTI